MREKERDDMAGLLIQNGRLDGIRLIQGLVSSMGTTSEVEGQREDCRESGKRRSECCDWLACMTSIIM